VAWYRRKLSIPPFQTRSVSAKNIERLAPISHTKLRQRCLLSGLTQRELAGRIGVSSYKVCEFVRLDGHFADIEVIASLADALHCSRSDILQDGWDLVHPPKGRVDWHGKQLSSDQIYPLRNGPYHIPGVCVGDKIECAFHGERTVKQFSKAPIPWPIAEEPGCTYIVCGDLVRALANESFRSVMYWWDVTPSTVSAWRRKLSILK
jgi:transcriptional regulator with XRE-family HTH domain